MALLVYYVHMWKLFFSVLILMVFLSLVNARGEDPFFSENHFDYSAIERFYQQGKVNTSRGISKNPRLSKGKNRSSRVVEKPKGWNTKKDARYTSLEQFQQQWKSAKNVSPSRHEVLNAYRQIATKYQSDLNAPQKNIGLSDLNRYMQRKSFSDAANDGIPIAHP